MKERPILFSGEMVRAILDGRKTQTRRVMKPQPQEGYSERFIGGQRHRTSYGWSWQRRPDEQWYECPNGLSATMCPYGVPGDRLWVRERFRMEGLGGSVCYFARCDCGLEGQEGEKGWKPSIHMPRWASRLTLEVTEVRVQRVQEISEEDAEAEGVDCCYLVNANAYARPPTSFRFGFINLWNSINAKRGYSWESNPWVWAITFKTAEGGR